MRFFFTANEIFESNEVKRYFHEFYFNDRIGVSKNSFRRIQNKFSKLEFSKKIQIYRFALLGGLDLILFDFELNEPIEFTNEDFEHKTNLLITLDSQLDFYSPMSHFSQNLDRTIFQTLPISFIPKGTINERVRLLILNFDIKSLEDFIDFPQIEPLNPEAFQFIRKNENALIYFNNFDEQYLKHFIRNLESLPFKGDYKRSYIMFKSFELIYHLFERSYIQKVIYSNKVKFIEHDYYRIRKAKEILLEHIENPKTISELSKLVGLNELKLKVGFKKIFGTTIHSYLFNFRMEKAKYLLKVENKNVTEVALEVGYSSLSKFSSAFQKKYGVNPSYFKNK